MDIPKEHPCCAIGLTYHMAAGGTWECPHCGTKWRNILLKYTNMYDILMLEATQLKLDAGVHPDDLVG